VTAAPIASAPPIDIVLARLTGVRRTGKHAWVARCPGHADSGAALTIHQARDGRVVLTCAAGCTRAAIATAIQMDVAELYPPRAASANGAELRAAPPAPEPVRRDRGHERRPPYSEEAEQAVLAALLIDPERIGAVLDVVTDAMFYAERHRRIFRAMAALADLGTIVDPLTVADRLDSRGELQGAGGKDYIGFLVDAVPTSANVLYHAGIVREKAQLRQLIDAAATLEREAYVGAIPAQALAREVSRVVLPLTEGGEHERLPAPIVALELPEDEPLSWIVDGLLVAGEVAVFAGDGGSYKSTAGLHLAAAIAGGYKAFSRFDTTPRATLILSAEDGRGVIKNRLNAICEGHAWDRTRALTNVHVLATHEAKLTDPAWQAHLLELVERLDIGFTLLDPLADLIDGDENSNSDLRPVIRLARRIATIGQGSVTFVHHATKVREGQRTIDRVRGASALRDAARCVLFFESKPEGIAVEHLKMSRSEKLDPFVLTREIESEADNRATWVSARFLYQSAGDAVLGRVESVLLDLITANPDAFNSTALKQRAIGAGIRGEDVSRGLSHLQARGLIDFRPGARGSRFWSSTLPTDPGKVKNDLAHLAPTSPGKVRDRSSDPAHLAPLKGGQARWAEGSAGQARIEAANEALEIGEVPEEYDL
jgi:hypothetical protein